MSKLTKVQERVLNIIRHAQSPHEVLTEEQPNGEGEWVVSGHNVRTLTLWALERQKLVRRFATTSRGSRLRWIWRLREKKP